MKHICIRRSKTNVHSDYLDLIRDKVYVGDYKVARSVSDVETLLKYKPILSNYYIIEISISKLNIDTMGILDKLVKKYNYMRLVILTESRDIMDKLEFCSIKIDCYHLNDTYIRKYIGSRVDVSNYTTEYMTKLYKKVAHNIDFIDSIILRMNNTSQELKLSEIRKDNQLSYLLFFSLLLLGGHKQYLLTPKDSINTKRYARDYTKEFYSFLEDYRNGMSYIYKSVISQMEELHKVYSLVNEGKLTEVSIHTYCSDNQKSEYVYKALHLLTKYVTYDKYMLIKERLYMTGDNNYSILETFFYLYSLEDIEVFGEHKRSYLV